MSVLFRNSISTSSQNANAATMKSREKLDSS